MNPGLSDSEVYALPSPVCLLPKYHFPLKWHPVSSSISCIYVPGYHTFFSSDKAFTQRSRWLTTVSCLSYFLFKEICIWMRLKSEAKRIQLQQKKSIPFEICRSLVNAWEVSLLELNWGSASLFLWFSILSVPLLMLILSSFIQSSLFCDWRQERALDLWEEDADRGHRLQWVRTKLCSIYKLQFLKSCLHMSRFFLHFYILWGLLFLGVLGLLCLKRVLSCRRCLTWQCQEEVSFFLS